MSRTIKHEYRNMLHTALVMDCAISAMALGDALMGGDVISGQLLRERLEVELRLLDDLAWAPDAARDHFELTLSDDQLARAARRLHCVGADLVAEYNATDVDQRTVEIEAGREVGLKVVLLTHHLLRDIDASDARPKEVC